MKTIDKKIMLARFFELLVFCGYDIKPYVGIDLSCFDFDKVKGRIQKLEKERDEQ